MIGKLFGIVGHKGSGKTSLTDAAINTFPIRVDARRISFSDPIIAMLKAARVPTVMLYDKTRWNEPLEMLSGKTIRHAAQTLGTEWGRECIGNEFWLNLALRRALHLREMGMHVIIDNVRFPNEFAAMKDAGAATIAVWRINLATEDDKHESEKHITALRDQCDFTMNNNGSFEDGVKTMRELLLTHIR